MAKNQYSAVSLAWRCAAAARGVGERAAANVAMRYAPWALRRHVSWLARYTESSLDSRGSRLSLFHARKLPIFDLKKISLRNPSTSRFLVTTISKHDKQDDTKKKKKKNR